MEAEHSAFRDLLSVGKNARASGDHHNLSVAASNLSALLQAHIAKEDTVLFPMAIDSLGEEQLRRMDATGTEARAARAT
jgi:hemerythrin-like domain-containing protein